jgi:hypothetical protein
VVEKCWNLPPIYGRIEMIKTYIYNGWSEPVAINAPVEDEAIEVVLGMNQKHILPCPKLLVFSTFFLPQNFSLLPTSLPPTYLT